MLQNTIPYHTIPYHNILYHTILYHCTNLAVELYFHVVKSRLKVSYPGSECSVMLYEGAFLLLPFCLLAHHSVYGMVLKNNKLK